MKISKLILKGFKPLALNDIDEISIDFIEDVTLVIGTNGSGKSSLLKELTPFPSSSSKFREGGMKETHITNNGDSYILQSYFKKDSKHTFIKNNETILNMGTTAMQRELVIREFNYTPLIHKILTGELRFTTMTPAARRDVMMSISNLDLDFAIKLHNLTKDAHRDGLGVLKHIVNKSSEAKLKLRGLNLPEDADVKNTELEEHLGYLIPYTVGKYPSLGELSKSITEDYNNLSIIKQKIDKFEDIRTPTGNISNIYNLNEYIGTCTGGITSAQLNINNLTAEVESMYGVTNSIVDNDLSLDDIQKRISIIENDLSFYTDTCFVNSNFDTYLLSLIDISHEFETIFYHSKGLRYLPKNEEMLAENNNANIRQLIINAKHIINKCVEKLEHLTDNAVSATCPKCNLVFNVNGISIQDNISKYSNIKGTKEEELKHLETQLQESNRLIENINGCKLAANRIFNLKKSVHMPFEFWDNIGDYYEMLEHPHKIRNYITTWRINIENGKAKYGLKSELESYKNALNVFTKYGSNVDARLSKLQTTIVNELNRKGILEQQITYCKRLLKNINHYTNLSDEANRILRDLNDKFKMAITVEIQSDAKLKCDSIYTELGKHKHLLTQRTNLIESITELEDDQKTLAFKQVCLAVLEENLSNKKGMIADEMLGFINSFIGQINIICNSLWEYNLEIIPCHMDNGILDYTFPLIAQDESVPDISESSKGQAEMIDLAFTMVMRQYTNITDFPIYLDETGSGFDDSHKKKLMDYIKQLIPNNLCSQIFIVNHYLSFHGGLSNHDTVVLDPRNIVVPQNYNEHIVITNR